MSFSLLKNAALGCLLAVLLFVVWIAYQHSQQSIDASSVFVERHLPAQQSINRFKETLFSANSGFTWYSQTEVVEA